MQQLLRLALREPGDRDAGPGGDDRRDVVGSDLLVHHPRVVGVLLGLLGLRELAFDAGDRLVLDAGGFLIAAVAQREVAPGLGLVELRAQLADPVEGGLLCAPPLLQRLQLVLLLAQALAELLEAFFAGLVLLLLERELLELHALHLPLQGVDLDRGRVDLHLQPAGCFVDEVDRLVGQLPGGDVPVREGGRGHQRGVFDGDAVVRLVPALQPTQDRDCVLHARLADVDLLEPALERRVLLDEFAVLVERGRADQAQLAAGQHGLQHVGGRDGALPAAGAHEDVQLVDEGDDLALRVVDLLEDGLQPLLELAAVHRGDQGGQVERHELLALERVGDVAGDDPLSEPLHDSGLADAGLTDEHGVVLGAPGQHLTDTPDLGVTPDHRVELAALRDLGEVDAVLFEGALRLLLRGGGALHVRHSPLFLSKSSDKVESTKLNFGLARSISRFRRYDRVRLA